MQYIVIILLLAAAACTEKKKHQQIVMDIEDISFENAHPKAQQLMKEDFFYSPIEETGPFGSDDGADAFQNFATWRKENSNSSTEQFLTIQLEEWDYAPLDVRETDSNKIGVYINASPIGSRLLHGIECAIIATAFGQLYLEGTIDENMRDIARTSIQRQLRPALLSTWRDAYQATRKDQLEKMLAVINEVK